MTARDSFVAHFGEEDATRIEEAALGHQNFQGPSHANDSWGSDPFKYHLLCCIGFDCFQEPHNATYHGIQAKREEIREWCLAEADLHEYDGDIPDYLGFLAGAYASWINWEKAGVEMPEQWANSDDDHERWRKMTPNEAAEELRLMAEHMMQMLNEHNWEEQ